MYASRLIGFILLSIALMTLDYQTHYLREMRSLLSTLAYPLQWVINAPGNWATHVSPYFQNKFSLIEENKHLHYEHFLTQAKLQKMLSLEHENARLRALLQTGAELHDAFLVAEILQMDPDPFVHVAVVNKGKRDGVFLGQPVVDAEGIMGKVIEINKITSRVMFITDTSHGIPVENIRNGVRAIGIGTGNMDKLELQHVPLTTDIKIGDKLVTSGLGGGYPAGYPVGLVSEFVHEAGAPFATIRVKPIAKLGQSRQILLIQTEPAAP